MFPKVKPHAPNTMLTPGDDGLSFIGRFGQKIWRLGESLKQKDIKYAFKAGMATAVLASPAFFERTRPWFIQYRGEWILISVMQVSCLNACIGSDFSAVFCCHFPHGRSCEYAFCRLSPEKLTIVLQTNYLGLHRLFGSL